MVREAEVDRFENQRRRLALGILPDHSRTLDTDFLLGQHPVADIAIAARTVDGDAGDVETAVTVATQMQRRLVDLQQAQTQPQVRYRRPRENAVHTREGQRRPPISAGDDHVRQHQVGIDAGPAGVDPPDADRQPDRAADLMRDFRPVILDVRQQQIAKCQNQEHEAKIE